MFFMNIILKTTIFRAVFYSEKYLKIASESIKLDNFVINRYNTRCCRHEMSKQGSHSGYPKAHIDDDNDIHLQGQRPDVTPVNPYIIVRNN